MMSIKQQLRKRHAADDLKKKENERQQYQQQCDDLITKDNDEVIAYIKSTVKDPNRVLSAAIEIAGEYEEMESLNTIMALFDFKCYDMDDDADVAEVKQKIANDPDYDMTPEEADEYVEEELVGQDVAVLEKLSMHKIGTIKMSNCFGWDMYRSSCRDATQDDADKAMQVMLDSSIMRDDFIKEVLGNPDMK